MKERNAFNTGNIYFFCLLRSNLYDRILKSLIFFSIKEMRERDSDEDQNKYTTLTDYSHCDCTFVAVCIDCRTRSS